MHWIQTAGSQTGTSYAMLRFSHCVVAVGQVPSGENVLTGRRSPSPRIMGAVTFLIKSGAWSGTIGGRGRPETFLPLTDTSWRLSSVVSTAAQFLLTTSSPFFP